MTNRSDLLVISASNGENLKLAERFAAAGRSRGMAAEVPDLTSLDLPLSTPMATAGALRDAVLVHRPAGERFHSSLDWVDSWHSFSFAKHHDPAGWASAGCG